MKTACAYAWALVALLAALAAMAFADGVGVSAESMGGAVEAVQDEPSSRRDLKSAKSSVTKIGADGSKKPGKNTWHFSMPSTKLTVTSETEVVFAWSGSLAHSLVQVSESGFNNCDPSGGDTLVEPTKKGSKTVGPFAAGTTNYYICGVSGHCQNGQRVEIAVPASG